MWTHCERERFMGATILGLPYTFMGLPGNLARFLMVKIQQRSLMTLTEGGKEATVKPAESLLSHKGPLSREKDCA